jgi:hypothetical protein
MVTRERETSGGRTDVNKGGGDIEGVKMTTATLTATPALGEVRLTW